MSLEYKKFINNLSRNSFDKKDLHIVRFFSSFAAISQGKVIAITEPQMKYCPLVESLYREVGSFGNNKNIKNLIVQAIEEKIHKFGHFTQKREILRSNIAVPYGASEMLMYARRKNIIDAAVIVCEGAGTVVVNKPETIQGIGARMNGLFFTTPTKGIIKDLKKIDCQLVSSKAVINQLEGVKKAISLGYKNIAVTINASMEESFSKLKKIEKDNNVTIFSLAICTTGINKARIKEIAEFADLVWSCASSELREIIGFQAIVQVSKKIPVYVLTKKGLKILSAYSKDKGFISNLDVSKQYLISSLQSDKNIKMGNFNAYIREAKLPIRDKKEPKLEGCLI